MSVIAILPQAVAERIAAGEVIDRPAAVVKELVENAIDAGASEVRIEARGGGLRLIRVADDGSGIPADQLELAFQRHATSKLRTLEDLDRLSTFGFRGEALASIAAVAEVTAVSAVEGAAAASCTFRAGRPLEREGAARARGTTVTVRDLFSQMPARLKFMRGARAEAIQIGAVVRRFALAYPELRFSLVLEGHAVFRSPGGSLVEALAAAYGDEAEALLSLGPVEAEGVRISGLIGGPGPTHASRNRVALFVNRRYVRSRALLTAIEDGYRPFVPRGRHPLAAVFLTAPAADLDVNVHPAKLDVRLRQESAVAAALCDAIRAAYGRQPQVLAAGTGRELSGRQRGMPGLRRVAEERIAFSGWETGWESNVQTPPGEALPPFRLVGQVGGALIVAEAIDEPARGLYLIDQHRAHERVLFERLLTQDAGGQQALIEPAVLRLAPAAAQRLSERLPALASLGFACEEFGADRFIVRATPAGESGETAGAMLDELLAEAAADRQDWRERLLASLACRAAIRKGRPLGQAEARDLLVQLSRVRSPAVCPHGSPVLLHVSEPLLARQFGWG